MNDDIEMSVWVKRGLLLKKREYLDLNDPDYPYNYIAGLGLCPENYGVYLPSSIHRCCECRKIESSAKQNQ